MFKRFLGLFTGKRHYRPPEDKESRLHHYIFAHQILPALFFTNPANFMAFLEKEDIGFLQTRWEKVGAMIKGKNYLPADGPGYKIEHLENGEVTAIITLPQPQEFAEAYFVATVYRPQTSNQDSIARFFTLEYGDSLNGNFRTVLCEWTPEKTHINYGDGPEPNPVAFLEAIRQKMK